MAEYLFLIGDTLNESPGIPPHGPSSVGSLSVLQIGPRELGSWATIEGMAAAAAKHILSVSAAGPVRLAGVGRGALLAIQVALNLQGRDVGVAFVGAIDVPAALIQPPLWLGDSLHVVVLCSRSCANGARTALLPAWKSLVSEDRLTFFESEDVPDALARLAALDGMVSLHMRAEKPMSSALQVIRESRQPKATLLCFPGAGDNITRFIDLASELGPTVTTLGLQPRGVDGVGVPYTSVQAAAKASLQALELTRLSAPVHLLGHSFGGWIAFETACLMAQAGRPAASLTLVDSEVPDAPDVAAKESSDHQAFESFVDIVEMSAPRPLNLRRAALLAAPSERWLTLLHESMVDAGLLSSRTPPSVLRGPFRTFCAALRTAYCPSLAAGTPVALVCIENQRLTPDQNTHLMKASLQGWRSLVPDLVAWNGPGNHMTVLAPPQVKLLSSWWLHFADGVSKFNRDDPGAPAFGTQPAGRGADR